MLEWIDGLRVDTCTGSRREEEKKKKQERERERRDSGAVGWRDR